MSTIFDVAKLAGVSYGTVSRVLNGSRHVHPQTREKVLQAMRELDFNANRQARNLAKRTAVTNTIGVLVPDLSTEYTGEILSGVDSCLSRHQMDIVLYTTHRIAEKEFAHITNLIRNAVDGLLILLPRHPADYIGMLENMHFPYVLIDHQGTRPDSPRVGATNYQGACDATRYLLSLGHRQIGFITGTLDMSNASDRLAGYKTALLETGISPDNALIFTGRFDRMDGFNAGNHFLDLPEPPTAIFASNDVMAYGVMDALHNRGLRVPQDMSLIGFDDIPTSAIIRPAMTTIRQPLKEIGSQAAQMLIKKLTNREIRLGCLELPTELIMRESCQPRFTINSDAIVSGGGATSQIMPPG